MPIQENDLIIINNKFFELLSDPLEAHPSYRLIYKFINDGDSFNYISQPNCNTRGYWSIWKLIGNRIYLAKVETFGLEMDNLIIDIFPDLYKGKMIFAQWFSGDLLIPFYKKAENDDYIEKTPKVDIICKLRYGHIVEIKKK